MLENVAVTQCLKSCAHCERVGSSPATGTRVINSLKAKFRKDAASEKVQVCNIGVQYFFHNKTPNLNLFTLTGEIIPILN